MARDPALAARPAPIYAHPWFLVLAGLALTAAGTGATLASAPALLRLLLIGGGMVTALTGLWLRFKSGRWDAPAEAAADNPFARIVGLEQIETAAMIATTGVATLL